MSLSGGSFYRETHNTCWSNTLNQKEEDGRELLFLPDSVVLMTFKKVKPQHAKKMNEAQHFLMFLLKCCCLSQYRQMDIYKTLMKIIFDAYMINIIELY